MKHNPNGEYAELNKPLVETQEQREARCHAECEEYYYGLPMTDQERVWLHRGIDSGAGWVDSGDRIRI